MRRLCLLLFPLLLAASCGSDSSTSEPTAAGDQPASTAEPAPTEPATTEPVTTEPATTESPTTTAEPRAIDQVPTPAASTISDLLALGRPIVAAHAGGDQDYPHSTMYGFTEAARAGVDVLEMDVQLTGDGVLVVQHDDTVDATTESSGRVRDLTLDELQALDNGYWWNDDWQNRDRDPADYLWRGVRTGSQSPPAGYGPDDFRVETFRSIAEAFPDHVLDVELKVPRGDDGEVDLEFAIAGAEVLAEEIQALGRTDSVIVVSFSGAVLSAFRDLAPEVATSPAEDELVAWYLGTAGVHPQDRVAQVPPTFEVIDVLAPDVVARVHDAGLAMWIWPNDADAQENADFYAEVIAAGADGIIAGRPAAAVDRYRADGLIPAG